jgi:flagellar hook-associated protein 2
MTIRDLSSGKEAVVALRDGDSRATVIARINTAFSAAGVRATAVDDAGRIRINGTAYGTSEGFRLTGTAGGASGLAQLGLVDGDYRGLDVIGTINGQAAMGRGQSLRSSIGDASGLAVNVTATTIGAIGDITVRKGIAQQLSDAATAIVAPRTGVVSRQQDVISLSIASLKRREENVTERIARRQEQLRQQFARAESVISRFQADAARLTGFSTQTRA